LFDAPQAREKSRDVPQIVRHKGLAASLKTPARSSARAGGEGSIDGKDARRSLIAARLARGCY